MKNDENAKAYEAALEAARKELEVNRTGSPELERVLCNVFPELAESEDERIGNVIYCIVRDNKEVKRILEGNGISVDNALAYLEKQKDTIQDKVEQRMGYLWDKLPDARRVEEGNCTPEEWKALGAYMELEMNFDKSSEEKQKGQRPTPKFKIGDMMRTKQEAAEGITDGMPMVVSIDEDYYICNNEKIPIINQDEYEFPPMNTNSKPAEWSEECIADVFEKVGLAKIAREQGNDELTNALQAAMLELSKSGHAAWSEDYEDDIQTRFAFYTYKDDPSVLYLSNVFVEETSRNHGFGTRILKAAEKAAEAIGAITIRLKVKQDSPANAWYRKNGYGYVAFEDGYDWLEKNLEYMKPNNKTLPDNIFPLF